MPFDCYRDIEWVRDNGEVVRTIPDRAARTFYERLFTLDPSTAGLLDDDMRDQQRRWISALHTAMHALDAPERLERIRVSVGKRHAHYGPERRHFDLVGQALLDTLDLRLGDAFTHQHRAAWERSPTLLSEVMIDAMEHGRHTRGHRARRLRLGGIS